MVANNLAKVGLQNFIFEMKQNDPKFSTYFFKQICCQNGSKIPQFGLTVRQLRYMFIIRPNYFASL